MSAPKPGGASSPLVGPTCLALFLLPFAAVGIVTAGLAVQRAAARNWRDALLMSVFALVFGGVGLGGIAGAVFGYGKLKKEAALQQAHPDQPWLWRDDWASGKIDDSSRTTMWSVWIFAALWNLISFPSAFLGVRAAMEQGNKAGFIALLFPLVGVGLLIWAVRSTLRYKKYGVSLLELSTVPGVIGHGLTGTVRAPANLRPAEGFQVTLSCVERVTTGSGKNSSTSENILWQEEGRVPGEPSRAASGMETRIPVAFRLPPDARACDATVSRDRVLWRLRVSASVPGVDYQSAFEVPVFRTPESDRPDAKVEAGLAENAPSVAKYLQPADSRIVVTTNRRGTEILFPAARNPGAAAGLTGFLLIWCGTIVVQVYLRAPIFFPIVTALFGILILIGALDLWLGVSRVTVDAGTVNIATGYLLPYRERTVAAADVSDVIATMGMRAGSKLYYDVSLVQQNGKKVTAGRSVRDKREAEWLAATIKRALGKA